MESVLESVGAADRTVDEEFDLFHQRYTAMMVDMNECNSLVRFPFVRNIHIFPVYSQAGQLTTALSVIRKVPLPTTLF